MARRAGARRRGIRGVRPLRRERARDELLVGLLRLLLLLSNKDSAEAVDLFWLPCLFAVLKKARAGRHGCMGGMGKSTGVVGWMFFFLVIPLMTRRRDGGWACLFALPNTARYIDLRLYSGCFSWVRRIARGGLSRSKRAKTPGWEMGGHLLLLLHEAEARLSVG